MKKANAGFTIIELMMTLTVAAIVLTLGIPAFTDTLRNNRLASQINDFVSAVNYARSEAVHRGANIKLCSSTDGATCTASPWHDGFIVVVSSSNEVLRINNPLSGTTTLTSAVNEIEYSSRGFLSDNTPRSFLLCGEAGKSGRQVDISGTGRPSNLTPYPTC